MDIDIDFADRNDALALFKYRIAARMDKTLHASGVYFHEIPHNPLTNISTLDFKDAESRGYFKIDFLNINVYKSVKSEEHLIKLMNTEPHWGLFEIEEFTKLLFQISSHGSLLKELKPKSIEQLAAIIALIRPAKKHLIGKPWDEIMKEIWLKDENGYFFKRAHAYSYAMAIIVQVNLICETLNV
jgi:hypothetical protein